MQREPLKQTITWFAQGYGVDQSFCQKSQEEILC